jgi:hypothetical protein
MVSVLSKSNWAKMERDAKKDAGTTRRSAKSNPVKTSQPTIGEQMAAAHDVGPGVVGGFQKTVRDVGRLPPDKGAVSDDCAHFCASPSR